MTVTTIKELSACTSTAVATYADLRGATTDTTLINALSNPDSKASFTILQATQFAQNYQLVDQLPNVPYNGFSAAVFFDKATGKHVIAMRGTEVPIFPQQTWLDLIVTDGLSIGANGFANTQGVEMFRYYKRLTTAGGQPVQYTDQETWQMFAMANSLLVPLATTMPLLTPTLAAVFQTFKEELAADRGVIAGQPAGQSVLSPSEKVDVTGHSLGGHLAMLFQRLFPDNTDQVVTLNAPGFFPQGDAALTKIGFPAWDPSKITRVEADGDGISKIGTIWPGATLQIAQENDSGAIAAISSNHSSVNGNDALSLMAMMAKLDPSLTNDSAKLSDFIRAASNKPENTYESVLDDLRAYLFGPDQVPTPVSSGASDPKRAELYENMKMLMAPDAQGSPTGIFARAIGNTRLAQAPSDGPSARTDFGALLALQNLTPFMLQATNSAGTSALESANLELAIQAAEDQVDTDAKALKGGLHFSDEYLTDRAAMLGWIVKRNQLYLTRITSVAHRLFQDIASNAKNVILAAGHRENFGKCLQPESSIGACHA